MTDRQASNKRKTGPIETAADEESVEQEAGSRSDAESAEESALDDATSSEDEETSSEIQDLLALDGETLLKLKQMAEERDLFRDELLRVKADLDNYQKRVRRDRPSWESHAVRRFLSDILPVLDNFELALESAGTDDSDGLRQGVELIYQLLRKVLEDNGVEEIKSLGEMFDPSVHEAVAEEEVSDRKTGEVVEVQQKGYLHKDIVVRPSRVKVAKNTAEEES